MEVHPAAAAFPMMSDHELDAMAEDIKRNGLRNPIVTWRGVIVDGRNRMAALSRTLTEPQFSELAGYEDEGDVIRWIISTNIHRRHLSESQRAMIASELAKLGHGQRSDAQICASSMTQDEAAERLQVSRRSVQAARQVQEQAPDLAARVKSGELKVSRAASLARERVRAQTDPSRADDSVIDRRDEAEASGYTPRMERVWAAYSALDAVEQTAFRERLTG